METRIATLRALCQDSGPAKRTQSLFGRNIRFISIYFTKLFIRLKVTPNQITFFGSIIYLIGIGCIATGRLWYGIGGFALLIIATVLDASDGEVFRYYGFKEGYGGSYVEPLSHDTTYALMFVPISIGAWLQTGNPYLFLAGASASIFKTLFRLTEIRFYYGVKQKLPRTGHVDETKPFTEQSLVSKLIYLAYRNSATSTGMLIPLLAAIIFTRLDIFIIAYSILFFGLWLGLFVRQIKRFSKISNQIIRRNQYIRDLRTRLKNKKVVVCDLDGTLVDTMGIFTEIASFLMAWKHGISRQEGREGYIRTSGIPFFKQLDLLFPGHAYNEEIATLFEERKVAATDHLEIAPDERKSLERLMESGIKVMVSSNNFQENVDRFVQFSGIGFADALGYRDGFSKGADHFSHIERTYGITKEDILFVGDSLSDMRTARAHGIDFIGKTGTFSKEDFEAQDSNVSTIKHLRELEDLLLY